MSHETKFKGDRIRQTLSTLFKRLSKREILNLFLVCAFPIHVWTIYLFLSDVQWVSERTNTWDAIGYGSYALVFAFIESLLFTLFIYLLSMLLPKGWRVKSILAMMSLISISISFWAIVNQLYFLIETASGQIFNFLMGSNHPMRYGFVGILILLVLVLASVIAPIFLIARYKKFEEGVITFIDRITLLSSLYLLMDLLGLFIIIYRNIDLA
jgi:hypothetical protein